MPLDDVLKTLLAEGAGEGEEGMYHIASVIMNRAKRRNQSALDVVNAPHQFTGRWRKDLDTFVAKQPPETLAAAQRALTRAMKTPVPGIDHYLTTQLYKSPQRPYWANRMKTTKTLGRHTFLQSQ